MIEVEIQKNVGDLCDLYRKIFTEKYDEEPHLDLERAKGIFRWCLKSFGLEKTTRLLTAYFGMTNEWVQNKGYPLEFFKENINEIIVSMPKKKSLKGNRTNQELYCDSCWVEFKAFASPTIDLDKAFIRCPDCQSKNAPWKYPTPEEFNRNWGKFSEAYGGPKPESYEKIFKEKEPYPKDRIPLEYTL